MKHYFAVLAALFLLASCRKEASKKYPYLNDSMNGMVTVNRAEYQARTFQAIANGKQMSYGGGKTTFAPLYEDRVDVRFDPSGIFLSIDIEMSHWRGFEKAGSEPEAKRIEACRKVCWRNIDALSKFLECDPALINTQWTCVSLMVQGTISGEDAVALIDRERRADDAEHAASSTGDKPSH